MLENLILIIFVCVNIPLGIAVYKNNPRSATNKLFAFLVFILTLYLVISDRMYTASAFSVKLFLARAIMVNAAFINLGVYLFLTTFPEKDVPLGKIKNLILWIGTIILALTGFTNLITKNINVSQDNIITVEQGALMPLFAIHTGGLIIGGLVSTLLKYRRSEGLDKTKIRYIFFAFVLLFLLILTFNFVFPAFLGIGSLAPFLPLYILIFLLIVSYAIVRHKLMELRLLVARSVVYTLITFIIGLLYFLVLFGIVNYFIPGLFNLNSIIISLILTLFAAFSFPWLRHLIEVITDKLLYKDHYDSHELLYELTRVMASELDLEKLTKQLQQIIIKKMRVTTATFILLNKKGKQRKQILTAGDPLKLEGLDLEILISLSQVTTLEEVILNSVKNLMNQAHISAIVPLYTKESGRFGIFALGPKNSGDIYTNGDLSFLRIFGQEAAVAIENAQAYKQIQEFAETLKQKVKDATISLRKANDKLKELDLRKDEFLNIAAHELRAPLSAVKGYLSMLIEGDAGKVPKTFKEFLDGGLEGAEREIRLVNNLLDVSRIEEGRLTYEMGKISLSTVVKTVFEEFKTEAETKKLKYELLIPKDFKDKVYVDQDRIHEVVANFISNAIKYTDKGSVAVQLGQPDPKTIRLEVSDTGFGMADQEQKKLFTKFYRAESSAGKKLGTGLGLYITKLLIEKFGGKLGLKSEKGKGSLFWFELPLVK